MKRKLQFFIDLSTGIGVFSFVMAALTVENSFGAAVVFTVLLIASGMTVKVLNHLIDTNWKP